MQNYCTRVELICFYTFQRKLMAKTLARYTVEGGRRTELRDWMEEKQQQQTSSVCSRFPMEVIQTISKEKSL